MRTAYFLFGSSIFTLAATATLLLTWTWWWMLSVGPSMPARRPFYKPLRTVPSLIMNANVSSPSSSSSLNSSSSGAGDESGGDLSVPLFSEEDAAALRVYAYTLHGGWPTFNSVLRLVASLLGTAASFSFALLATRLPHVLARRVFSTVLFAVVWLALGAAVLDSVAIARTASECARTDCVTAVPDAVRDSRNVCVCSVEGWFYATLLADVALAAAALVCFIVTVRPALAAAVANTVPTQRQTVSHESLASDIERLGSGGRRNMSRRSSSN